MFSSRDLYRRGMATLVASWEAYAGGSAGAAVIRSPGLTASLQSTEMAERVYATVGFHDLGRILEYVPG